LPVVVAVAVPMVAPPVVWPVESVVAQVQDRGSRVIFAVAIQVEAVGIRIVAVVSVPGLAEVIAMPRQAPSALVAMAIRVLPVVVLPAVVAAVPVGMAAAVVDSVLAAVVAATLAGHPIICTHRVPITETEVS
jgi:hypothetical protein